MDFILASVDDKEILGKAMQAEFHLEWGCRNDIGEYVVNKKIRIPTSITKANLHLDHGKSTK